jgi:hypothetical protein
VKHHTIAKALSPSQGESVRQAAFLHMATLDSKGTKTRVLGVCQDGPAEVTRVWFKHVPQIGDLVRVRHNIGGVGQRQNMVPSPNGPITGSIGIWVEAEIEWCIYRVDGLRVDPMGVVCDMQYLHTVNL